MNKKAFGTRLLAVVVYGLPVLGLAAQAEGSVDVTLLDKTYTRATGAPTATVDRFPALPGSAMLTVLNLGDVGERVSSAVVKVNGVVVFGPEHFNQHAARLEAAIEVARQNEVSVELGGGPGGRLNLVVVERIEADAGAVIGPLGGSVVVADATSSVLGASLLFPPGAVADETLVSIAARPDAPRLSDGSSGISAVEIEPSGLVLGAPATLTLPYRDGQLDPLSGLGEETLSILTFDPETNVWVGLTADPPDTLNKRVSSREIAHFSIFLLAEGRIRCGGFDRGRQEYLPVLLLHGIQVLPVNRALCLTNPLLCVLPQCTWGSYDNDTWADLPALFDNNGVDFCELNYNTAPGIDKAAGVLRKALDRVLVTAETRYGNRPGGVTVIAHSMGGLVARHAVQNDAEAAGMIASITTLDTPHLGSGLGPLAGCTSGDQMAPGGSFLEGSPDGLNTQVRRDGPPDLSSCRTDYNFFASDSWDVFWLWLPMPVRVPLDIVAEESALGLFWNPWPLHLAPIFEPPQIELTRREKPDPVNPCGRDADQGCTHRGDNGIAAVWSADSTMVTSDHVMWLRLMDIIRSQPWFTGHRQCPAGPGGRLFYLNPPNQTSTVWSIWETDLHRQTSRKLTDLTGFFHVSDLVVSSDGERLAFWATLGGAWDGGASGEVYVLNTDPTNVNVRQVTSLPGAPFASAPRWSPSNQDILYYQYNPGSGNPNESIRKLDLDTSLTTTYPQGYGQAAKGWDIGNGETTALIVREPWCCWHPNAFTAYYDLASGAVQAPFVQASDGRSESSPRINRTDGWIAFLDEVQGGTGIADIFLMNPSGGEKAALTNAPAASRFGPPIWAGGNHTGYVVFETSFFGASEIVAMKAGDAWPAGVIRLTSPQVHAPAGDKLAPAWTARR